MPLNIDIDVQDCETLTLEIIDAPVSPSGSIDDDAGLGDTYVTWSADKSSRELADKVDKAAGLGLSELSFTTDDKNSLDQSEQDRHTHANKSVIDDLSDNAGALEYRGLPVSDQAALDAKVDKVAGYSLVADDEIAKMSTVYSSLGGARTVVTSRNIFDLSRAVDGYRINPYTGATFLGALYTASDFTPVEPFTNYRLSAPVQWALFDDGKNFVAGGFGGDGSFNSGAASFVRFDMLTAQAAGMMLARTADYPDTYDPFSEGVVIPGLVYDSQRVEEVTFPADRTLRSDLKVSYPNIPFLTRVSINLFDKDAPGIIHGYRLNPSSGALVVMASNTISEYIPVEQGATYSVSEGSYTCEYGEDKAWLSGHGVGITTFTVGPNTRFIRTTVRVVRLDDFMLIEGDQAPTLYQPYNVWAFNETIASADSEGSRWSGKKWNAMGDSITAAAGAYWSILAGELEFSVARNYGIGGTAVAVRAAPWDLNAMCLRYVDMDDDADLITVMCGTNDYNQVPIGEFTDTANTTFFGALHILCAGLVNKYPTKTIAFFTLPPRSNMQAAGLGGKTVFDYADAIKRVCQHYAIPVFDTLRSSQLRPFNEANKAAYMPDGLHPNADGYNMLAVEMRRFLEAL